MAKDFVINTDRVNAYGTRVLTSGLDTEQFERNPVLLYMHTRGFDGKSMPIGRVENLRKEGNSLIGTPVFDMADDFAASIAQKWDNNFLRMCSAGIEFIELSSAPEHLLPGQTRETIIRGKLIEVSIVDIGANDDALQLYNTDGKLINLAAGAENALIPLLKPTTPGETEAGDNTDNNPNTNFTMNKILLTLGLAATANEDDAVNAITALKNEAGKAEKIELARIESTVNAAVADKRITADKKNHFMALGRAAGYESLQCTLDLLQPTQKPTDIIGRPPAHSSASMELAFSAMSDEQLSDLRTNNRTEYIKLYKKEFGFEPEFDKSGK